MRTTIPKTALLVGSIRGTIQAGCKNDGKKFRADLYEAYCSYGYKSNFEHKKTLFITFTVEGNSAQVLRYTGKNINIALAEWQNIKKTIVE